MFTDSVSKALSSFYTFSTSSESEFTAVSLSGTSNGMKLLLEVSSCGSVNIFEVSDAAGKRLHFNQQLLQIYSPNSRCGYIPRNDSVTDLVSLQYLIWSGIAKGLQKNLDLILTAVEISTCTYKYIFH